MIVDANGRVIAIVTGTVDNSAAKAIFNIEETRMVHIILDGDKLETVLEGPVVIGHDVEKWFDEFKREVNTYLASSGCSMSIVDWVGEALKLNAMRVVSKTKSIGRHSIATYFAEWLVNVKGFKHIDYMKVLVPCLPD